MLCLRHLTSVSSVRLVVRIRCLAPMSGSICMLSTAWCSDVWLWLFVLQLEPDQVAVLPHLVVQRGHPPGGGFSAPRGSVPQHECAKRCTRADQAQREWGRPCQRRQRCCPLLGHKQPERRQFDAGGHRSGHGAQAKQAGRDGDGQPGGRKEIGVRGCGGTVGSALAEVRGCHAALGDAGTSRRVARLTCSRAKWSRTGPSRTRTVPPAPWPGPRSGAPATCAARHR